MLRIFFFMIWEYYSKYVNTSNIAKTALNATGTAQVS
jgi:hypothetical protein